MIGAIIQDLAVFTFGYVLGSIAALKHREEIPNFIKRIAGVEE